MVKIVISMWLRSKWLGDCGWEMAKGENPGLRLKLQVDWNLLADDSLMVHSKNNRNFEAN